MKSNYKETWHILHFILTLLFLPYGLLWLLFTLRNNAHNRRVEHQELMQALLHRSERQEDV